MVSIQTVFQPSLLRRFNANFFNNQIFTVYTNAMIIQNTIILINCCLFTISTKVFHLKAKRTNMRKHVRTRLSHDKQKMYGFFRIPLLQLALLTFSRLSFPPPHNKERLACQTRVDKRR